jgi:hypothetical protein
MHLPCRHGAVKPGVPRERTQDCCLSSEAIATSAREPAMCAPRFASRGDSCLKVRAVQSTPPDERALRVRPSRDPGHIRSCQANTPPGGPKKGSHTWL